MSSASRKSRGILANRVALIVGGNADGSRELAMNLADLGSDIAIIYFNSLPSEAWRVKQEIENQGRRCLLIASADLADGQLHNAVDLVHRELDHVDLYIDFSEDSTAGAEFRNGRRPSITDLFPHYRLLEAVLGELTDSGANESAR